MSANNYRSSDVLNAVLNLFPYAMLDEDNDGQLIIYTDCNWTDGGNTITGEILMTTNPSEANVGD